MSYQDDWKAKMQDHTVVRLASNHCEFSPIEKVWFKIKGDIALENTCSAFKMADVDVIVEGATKELRQKTTQITADKSLTWAESKMHQLDNLQAI